MDRGAPLEHVYTCGAIALWKLSSIGHPRPMEIARHRAFGVSWLHQVASLPPRRASAAEPASAASARSTRTHEAPLREPARIGAGRGERRAGSVLACKSRHLRAASRAPGRPRSTGVRRATRWPRA